MGSKKKKKEKLIGGNKASPARSAEAGAEGTSSETVSEAGPSDGRTRPAPKGFNRIPYWLRHELGLSDTVAGTIVVLASGAAIMLVVYLLSLVWPAS